MVWPLASRLKGIIPTETPAFDLYDRLAGVLGSWNGSTEAAVRTLAWAIAGILAAEGVSNQERERLVDLVSDDINLIVSGYVDEE